MVADRDRRHSHNPPARGNDIKTRFRKQAVPGVVPKILKEDGSEAAVDEAVSGH